MYILYQNVANKICGSFYSKNFCIRCTNKFPPFLIINWVFIVKERNLMFYSKYWPPLDTTFPHLSGSIRIPRRKNTSSFKVIHKSTLFLVFSYDVKCCSDKSCVIDRNKWKSEGAMSSEYGGWGETSHLSVSQ